MSRLERLHVPHGHYFVVDEFRANEVLVPAPDRSHTEAQLRDLAAHRAQYEAQLTYAITRWCARVHTHCWLPECALLEIQISWAPLERVMHSLRSRFSNYMRTATGSPDPGYARRYRAWLLDPACTLDLRRELCWRPVRAGLCELPAKYGHTSIHYAVNGSPPPFLARSQVLAWFRQRQRLPQSQLVSLFSVPPSADFAALTSGSPHDRRIIGHRNFVRKTLREERRPPLDPPSDSVLEWVRQSIAREITPRKGSTGPQLALVSALTGWLLSCLGFPSASAIAGALPALDRSQLERAIDHYMQVHPSLFSERMLRQFARRLLSDERERPKTARVPALATECLPR